MKIKTLVIQMLTEGQITNWSLHAKDTMVQFKCGDIRGTIIIDQLVPITCVGNLISVVELGSTYIKDFTLRQKS